MKYEYTISNIKYNSYEKIITAVFLLSLFELVVPQRWDEMLNYATIRIPQRNYDQDYSKTVRFHLWTSSTVNRSVLLKIGDSRSLIKSNFDSSKPTNVMIHGFLNSVESPATQTIKNAVLQNCDVNFIGVDWGDIAINPNYLEVVSHVRDVGNYVCELFLFLTKHTNIQAKKVHLIGHSLGAHVSGFAGKTCQAHAFRIGRISGLDPALPGFYGAKGHERLDKKDADSVDCMHTSAGTYGYIKPICHADFYPNWGVKQPYCVYKDLAGGVCSHLSAVLYWAESANASHIFEANSCVTPFYSYHENSCQHTRMGYYMDPKNQGVYHLNTRDSYPFALKIVNKSYSYCG